MDQNRIFINFVKNFFLWFLILPSVSIENPDCRFSTCSFVGVGPGLDVEGSPHGDGQDACPEHLAEGGGGRCHLLLGPVGLPGVYDGGHRAPDALAAAAVLVSAYRVSPADSGGHTCGLSGRLVSYSCILS